LPICQSDDWITYAATHRTLAHHGVGILLAAVALSTWSVAEKTAQIDRETAQVHRIHEEADDALTEIRSGVFRAALLVRGHLLDWTPESPAPVPKEIAAIQVATDQHLHDLDARLSPGLILPLRNALAGYWRSLDLILGLSPDVARHPQQPLLRQKAVHLEAILKVTDQIDNLNTANFQQQERELRRRRLDFSAFLYRSRSLVLLLGLMIAIGSVWRLSSLQRRSAEQKSRAERAQAEMRRLSHQLVAAQEKERKTISRELHDEIGQMLTGLRMELGSLARLHAPEHKAFRDRLESVKALAEETMGTVRTLAHDLRPPMLDDLGIGPALRTPDQGVFTPHRHSRCSAHRRRPGLHPGAASHMPLPGGARGTDELRAPRGSQPRHGRDQRRPARGPRQHRRRWQGL
jgi:Histidine kinase